MQTAVKDPLKVACLSNNLLYPFRMNVVSVNMRRGIDDADGCMDVLHILDLNDIKVHNYTLCGSLADFTLFLSSQVQIELNLGDLEAEMPDTIGFNILYESMSKLFYTF